MPAANLICNELPLPIVFPLIEGTAIVVVNLVQVVVNVQALPAVTTALEPPDPKR